MKMYGKIGPMEGLPVIIVTNNNRGTGISSIPQHASASPSEALNIIKITFGLRIQASRPSFLHMGLARVYDSGLRSIAWIPMETKALPNHAAKYWLQCIIYGWIMLRIYYKRV